MNESFVLSENLKVGDRISFWGFDDDGAVVTKIEDYNGPFEFVHGIATLRGKLRYGPRYASDIYEVRTSLTGQRYERINSRIITKG